MPARWRAALLAGICFGLGYGLMLRLMNLELPRTGRLVESFRMREFPGTTLASLRLRVSGETRPIRGDLAALDQEERQRQEEAERRRREQELDAERQRDRLEDSLQRDLEPEPESPPMSEPAIPAADDPPAPVELPEPASPEPLTP